MVRVPYGPQGHVHRPRRRDRGAPRSRRRRYPPAEPPRPPRRRCPRRERWPHRCPWRPPEAPAVPRGGVAEPLPAGAAEGAGPSACPPPSAAPRSVHGDTRTASTSTRTAPAAAGTATRRSHRRCSPPPCTGPGAPAPGGPLRRLHRGVRAPRRRLRAPVRRSRPGPSVAPPSTPPGRMPPPGGVGAAPVRRAAGPRPPARAAGRPPAARAGPAAHAGTALTAAAAPRPGTAAEPGPCRPCRPARPTLPHRASPYRLRPRRRVGRRPCRCPARRRPRRRAPPRPPGGRGARARGRTGGWVRCRPGSGGRAGGGPTRRRPPGARPPLRAPAARPGPCAAALDDLRERPRTPRRRRRVVHHRPQRAQHRVAPERRPALHRGVQQHPQRPQVRGGPRRPPHGPLGRQVLRRPHELARHRELRGPRHQGYAEVGQHDPAVVAQHHVAGLDVPVQHARRVRGAQRGQHLRPDPGGAARRQRALRLEHIGQGESPAPAP